MNPVGLARVDIEVNDLSVLIATGLKGVVGVLGITEFGEIGKPKLIGSWPEYVRNFGSFNVDSTFPLICRRALEGGSKLRVSRVAHYSDITDTSTLEGDKATDDLIVAGTGAVLETRATSLLKILDPGINAEILQIDESFIGTELLCQVTVVTGETIASLRTKINAAVNAGTALHGFSSANGGGANEINISAPVGMGAAANTETLNLTITGATLDVTANPFSGGVTAADAIPAGILEVFAKSVGVWGNDLTVDITAAANGVAAEVDIKISLDGYPGLTYTWYNMPETMTTLLKDQFNAAQNFIDITQHTLVMSSLPINLVLIGGTQDISLINTTDYIGDVTSLTGIQSFNDITDIVKISVPEKAIPAIDTALSLYADARKDLIALVRTPLGVNGAGVVDYREGTGAYSHQAIDSWRCFLHTGGLNVLHPVTGLETEITELGDIFGLMAKKDTNSAEWFSFSGPKRGKIKNALGVLYNFGSPANSTEADNVDLHGINMTIQHPSFGIVSWGNNTLWKTDSLLKKAEVAELMIFLQRTLIPLIMSELFDPNDIKTWKNIYRRVKPFMDSLVDGRALWKYLYQGDQDVDNVGQCVVNEPANIDAGVYKFNLWLAPIVAMKYVGVAVNITNSSVDFTLLEGQPS